MLTGTGGNSLGITTPTVKCYVDFPEEAFLLKSLQPYSWNMSKRLVKSPKVYLTDKTISISVFIGLSKGQESIWSLQKGFR